MSDPQHIAYEVSHKALREAKQRAVQEFLDKVDCYDSNDIDDMGTAISCIEHAFDLCAQAEKIARQMMQATDQAKGVAELMKRRPGYADETYAKAMNEAILRLSR